MFKRALPLLVLACAIAAIPSALGFHVAVSGGVAACRPLAISFFTSPLDSRYPPRKSALRMAAASEDDEKPPTAGFSAAARKATQSLTSPVRKTDRRSPTRIISKPSANARATMTLGGDKIPTKKTETSDETKEKTETDIESKKVSVSSTTATGGGRFLGGSYDFADFQPPFAEASVRLANGLTNDGPFAW